MTIFVVVSLSECNFLEEEYMNHTNVYNPSLQQFTANCCKFNLKNYFVPDSVVTVAAMSVHLCGIREGDVFRTSALIAYVDGSKLCSAETLALQKYLFTQSLPYIFR